jgi:membrane protein implicated in regulation of membrane protease activity
MDTLNITYLVAFVAGATFTLISFFLGGGGDHAVDGADGGVDGGADGSVDGGADGSVDGGHVDGGHVDGSHGATQHGGPVAHGAGHGLSTLFSPLLNLYAISVLACMGGGAGLLVRLVTRSTLASLAVALPVGLVSAYLIGGFMTVLKRSTRFQTRFNPVGTVATVIAPCSGQSVGEILFVREGKRCSMPARASDQRTLDNGTEVIITEVTGGIAKVAVASELLATTKEA